MLLWLTGMGIGAPKAYGGAVTVGRLRCELQTLPLGIDVVQPRLSWTLSSTSRGERQTAYQILVARSRAALASGRPDLWDSGRVQSDLSAHVAYGGAKLASRQRVYWKVRTWDEDQVATPYSPPAWWEMGLLEAKDWQASWIGVLRAVGTDVAEYGREAGRVTEGCRSIET